MEYLLPSRGTTRGRPDRVTRGIVRRALGRGLLKGLAGLQIPTFTPAAIGTVLLLVMGTAFVPAVLPASRTARQSPIDSLRYE